MLPSVFTYINPLYLTSDKITYLKKELYSEKYVKYIVLDDFLQLDFYKELTWALIKKKWRWYFDASIAWNYKSWRKFFQRSNIFAALTQLYLSKWFSQYVSVLFGKKCQLQQSLDDNKIIYFFLKLLWLKGAMLHSYQQDDFLTWHTDGPIGTVVWSMVYFMNDKWNEADGGCLQLWKKTTSPDSSIIAYQDIPPIWNRLVLFLTEHDTSWHRVAPVSSPWFERISFHEQFFTV